MGLEKLKESPHLIPRVFFILLTLIVAVLTLLFTLTVFPILLLSAYFYRKFIDFLAHFVHGKEIRKIVTLVSSTFAADGIYDRTRANILALLTVEGNIDIHRFRELFTQNVLNAKSSSDGELKYPELQQYIVNWGGYRFWKDCPDFNLEEHVRLYNDTGASCTDKDILELRKSLANANWKRGKPLWEFILVQNCYPKGAASNPRPHTTIFVRWHHSIGDGYSWLHLIINNLCQRKKFENALPSVPRRSLASRLLFWASFPFRSAWALAEFQLLQHFHFDWRVPVANSKVDFLHVVTEPIPLETIKEIKNHFGVSFASVLHAVLTGVNRKMLQRKGFRVPKELPCWMVLPLPGHSLKLRNILTGSPVWLPTSETDRIQALLICNEETERVKKTVFPLLANGVMKIAGIFPYGMALDLTQKSPFPTGLTNFPGGMETIYLDSVNKQNPCIDVHVIGSLPSDGVGVGFEIVSYSDSIRICSIGDPYLFTREEMDGFNEAVYEEIDLIRKAMI